MKLKHRIRDLILASRERYYSLMGKPRIYYSKRKIPKPFEKYVKGQSNLEVFYSIRPNKEDLFEKYRNMLKGFLDRFR